MSRETGIGASPEQQQQKESKKLFLESIGARRSRDISEDWNLPLSETSRTLQSPMTYNVNNGVVTLRDETGEEWVILPDDIDGDTLNVLRERIEAEGFSSGGFGSSWGFEIFRDLSTDRVFHPDRFLQEAWIVWQKFGKSENENGAWLTFVFKIKYDEDFRDPNIKSRMRGLLTEALHIAEKFPPFPKDAPREKDEQYYDFVDSYERNRLSILQDIREFLERLDSIPEGDLQEEKTSLSIAVGEASGEILKALREIPDIFERINRGRVVKEREAGVGVGAAAQADVPGQEASLNAQIVGGDRGAVVAEAPFEANPENLRERTKALERNIREAVAAVQQVIEEESYDRGFERVMRGGKDSWKRIFGAVSSHFETVEKCVRDVSGAGGEIDFTREPLKRIREAMALMKRWIAVDTGNNGQIMYSRNLSSLTEHQFSSLLRGMRESGLLPEGEAERPESVEEERS